MPQESNFDEDPAFQSLSSTPEHDSIRASNHHPPQTASLYTRNLLSSPQVNTLSRPYDILRIVHPPLLNPLDRLFPIPTHVRLSAPFPMRRIGALERHVQIAQDAIT